MENPQAFIQWKGTEVCMDVYCVCGGSYHIDADFAYFVQCPSCEQILEMAHMIAATPVQKAIGHKPHVGSDFSED